MKKPQKSQRRLAREYAVQALYQWQLSQPTLDELLQQFPEEHDFSAADREYWQRLVEKTIVEVEPIDEAITPCVTRPLKEVNPVELAILRVATSELLFSLEIPYKVVINEAVELAKHFGSTESHRFVNAAMDQLRIKLRTAESS